MPPLGLSAGMVDISNCFYRFRVRRELAEFFALPPVRTDRCRFAPSGGGRSGWAYPCLGVLAMGFSWSLAIVQRINECDVSRCLGGRFPLQDAGPPAVFGEESAKDGDEKHFINADNTGVFAGSTVRVEEMLDQVELSLNKKGLATHQRETSSRMLECLGVELDLVEGISPLTQKRYWRLQKCLSWMLRPGRISRKALEVVIGHRTFAALVSRHSLAVFASCYRSGL